MNNQNDQIKTQTQTDAFTPITTAMDLWTRLIGETPDKKQFVFWLEAYGVEVTRKGILRTAERNLYMGNMKAVDRVRFATAAMKQDSAKEEKQC